MKYEFHNKALFFPDEELLVIGDLHIGFEHSIRQAGILIPEMQIRELIEELKQLISKLSPKKIVFIGDIKHAFGFEKDEKYSFRELFNFLKSKFKEKDIIFIKGNHDTIDYSFMKKLKEIYSFRGIAFIHGDKFIKKAFSTKIHTIVIGHIHPSIVLKDRQGIKKEKYKCFLVGEFKKKKIIVLPSFLDFFEGTPVNEYADNYKDSFSIIPKKALLGFEAFACGKDNSFDFGKVKAV